MGIEIRDNRAAARAAMERAIQTALTAIGLAAVEVTTDYMQTRYGAPIRQTGDLMRDLNQQPSQTPKAVDVGNSLEYAEWVHNGTRRMAARPYLKDALTENTDIWKEIAAEHIGEEMR